MTTSELAEQLTLLQDRGPALRRAGYRSIKLGDVELELDQATEPLELGAESQEDPIDPLNDPHTFGRTDGVPGLRHDPYDEE